MQLCITTVLFICLAVYIITLKNHQITTRRELHDLIQKLIHGQKPGNHFLRLFYHEIFTVSTLNKGKFISPLFDSTSDDKKAKNFLIRPNFFKTDTLPY